MKIANLNEDCLLLILGHLPLMTQCRIALLVCTSWYRLIEYLHGERKKLTIVWTGCSDKKPIYSIINAPYHDSRHHLVVHSSEDRNTDELKMHSLVKWILSRFHRIESFELIHKHLFEQHLWIMLGFWGSKLKR